MWGMQKVALADIQLLIELLKIQGVTIVKILSNINYFIKLLFENDKVEQ